MIGRECRDHRHDRQYRFERQHRLDPFAGNDDPRLRGGRLDSAETHTIAEQVTEGAARIGDRRLVRPAAIEPGALNAGDPAAGIGDGGEQRRPRFERCPFGVAVPDPRVKAERHLIHATGDAASAEIGFGMRAGDRAACAEQAASGLG